MNIRLKIIIITTSNRTLAFHAAKLVKPNISKSKICGREIDSTVFDIFSKMKRPIIIQLKSTWFPFESD